MSLPEKIESLGGWDTELLAVIDWEIYSRMIRKGGGICYLHEVLAIIRLHDNRASATSALHWDFYHDVLILSRRPEHRLGALFKARAVMEQLLWDLRLERPPWATLRHAWRYGAITSVLALWPYDIMRRVLIKIATVWKRRRRRADTISPVGGPFDREAFDAFWKDINQEHCAPGN